jgi:hypothetical protein
VKEPQIYCPKCKWRPQPESLWVWLPACGTEWNTFWTAGVCPGCARQWAWTDCLACHKPSLHKDWYHFPDEGEPAQEQTEPLPAHAEP